MNNCNTCKANKVCDHTKYGFENCNNYIPEDAVEAKPGKWKRRMDPELDCECITCSACGEEFCPPNNEWVFYDLPNYCSNCGAKMKGNK